MLPTQFIAIRFLSFHFDVCSFNSQNDRSQYLLLEDHKEP